MAVFRAFPLRVVSCLGLLIISTQAASGMRALRDNLVNCPIQVQIDGQIVGSGFYLSTSDSVYFVTAKHVIFDRASGQRRGKLAALVSYPPDPKASQRIVLRLDLEALDAAGKIKRHNAQDALVILVANFVSENGRGPADYEAPMKPVKEVMALEMAPGGLGLANLDMTLGLDQVLVSNDVFVFGYPASLGMKQVPQIDYARPLLRKGIVAGINQGTKSIILDCPAYGGNSGGPVVQVDQPGLSEKRFSIVGIVTEMVPYDEQWINITQGYSHITRSNSGYSIAVPMDPIYELIGARPKAGNSSVPLFPFGPK